MARRLALYAAVAVFAVGGWSLVARHRSTAELLPHAGSFLAYQQPEIRELTIPSGTSLTLSLDDSVGSATSRVDDPVRAHLVRAVVVDGITAIPENSKVSGAVTMAERSGRVKGRARVALRFDSLTLAGQSERYNIRTATVARTAPGTKKKDALEIGLPAAGGAAVGALLGGKKGAAIGGAVGGGAGTAAVLSTRGAEVRLGGGATLTVKLVEPLTVRVRAPRTPPPARSLS